MRGRLPAFSEKAAPLWPKRLSRQPGHPIVGRRRRRAGRLQCAYQGSGARASNLPSCQPICPLKLLWYIFFDHTVCSYDAEMPSDVDRKTYWDLLETLRWISMRNE